MPPIVESTSTETAFEAYAGGEPGLSSQLNAPPVPTKGGRLLCMDGGGIRGLILVHMLLEIEKLSKTPVHHMFDWVAGTSTGGILALALGSGKTMRQCMCMYMRIKDHAFIGSRPYASDNLEAVLKENLGEYTVMTDIKHPKIMVTGVMADRKPVDLHLFRNYTCASDILGIVTPMSEFLRRDDSFDMDRLGQYVLCVCFFFGQTIAEYRHQSPRSSSSGERLEPLERLRRISGNSLRKHLVVIVSGDCSATQCRVNIIALTVAVCILSVRIDRIHISIHL